MTDAKTMNLEFELATARGTIDTLKQKIEDLKEENQGHRTREQIRLSIAEASKDKSGCAKCVFYKQENTTIKQENANLRQQLNMLHTDVRAEQSKLYTAEQHHNTNMQIRSAELGVRQDLQALQQQINTQAQQQQVLMQMLGRIHEARSLQDFAQAKNEVSKIEIGATITSAMSPLVEHVRNMLIKSEMKVEQMLKHAQTMISAPRPAVMQNRLKDILRARHPLERDYLLC